MGYLQKAYEAALHAEIARLGQHVADLIDASGQECACGYDKPDDVCLGHQPLLKRKDAEIARLREVMRIQGNLLLQGTAGSRARIVGQRLLASMKKGESDE